jgi:hypothetical protein
MRTRRPPIIVALPITVGWLFLSLTLTACDNIPISSARPGGSAPSPPGPPATTEPPTPPPLTAPRPVCSISPADNHQAITAAIRACSSGSTVTFPRNATYHITDKIVVAGRTDLVIDGNGSTFTKTSPYADGVWKPQWVLSGCTDLVIRNMTVVGAFPTNPRDGVPGNQFEPGINIAGCRTATVQDLTVRNVFGDCVLVLDPESAAISYNIRIERLTCHGPARHAVVPVGVVGFWLEESILSDIHYSGIDAEMDIAGQPIQDVHILNNTITGFFISGFGVPVKGTTPGQVANIEIRGNTIGPSDTCWPALLIVYPPNNVGNETIRLDGIVITKNTLRSLHHGIDMVDVNSGSIRNNTIEAIGAGICGPGRQAVKLINSPNVGVSGNTLVGY